MREKLLKIALILPMVLVIFSSSCNIFEPSTSNELIDGFIVDIEFSDMENNEVNFSLETVFYYWCFPYKIKFDCLIEGSKITINILYIIEPEWCIVWDAPATGNEVKKVPYGEYFLIIRHLNNFDIYILTFLQKQGIKKVF